MRGKFVNLSLGIINILFGILILIFQIYVPQNISSLTVQENQVVGAISLGIKALLVFLTVINSIALYNNRMESGFKSGYRIAILTLAYFLLPEFIMAVFPILAGSIIINKVMKENLIELDSIFALSINVLIFALIIVLIGSCFFYRYLGQYLYKKQNKGEQAYAENFFKYVTELNNDDVYIEFKVDDKYGYINQKGEIVIDFIYDYASPFVKINMFNKNFEIALVCKDNQSMIIMKNQRVVKSYVSESSTQDYEEKIKELEEFYTKELKQTLPMQYEVSKVTDRKNKAKAYDEKFEDYTHKYDYNNDYDVAVIESTMGLGDTYYLIRKDDEKNRITLECENLDYDDKYLYLYRNGDLPYYSINEREQGWFNSYGVKTNMKGKAQILEIIDQTLLIKNYNDKTIYFIDAYENIISSIYKNIYICPNDRYIVQNTNGKYTLISGDYSQVFSEEYDFIDPTLAECGLYICGNLPDEIELNDFGYAKLNLKINDLNGGTLIDNVEQVYSSFYKISDSIRDKDKKMEDLKDRIKELKFEFVGNKFYERYE